MRKLSLQYKKIEQKCTIWRVTCWWACICALHLNGSRREMPKCTICRAAGGPVLPPLWMQSSLWKLIKKHLGERILTVWIPFSCLFSLFSQFGIFCYCFSCRVIDLVSDASCQGQVLSLGRLSSETGVKRRWKAGEGENIRGAFCGSAVLPLYLSTHPYCFSKSVEGGEQVWCGRKWDWNFAVKKWKSDFPEEALSKLLLCKLDVYDILSGSEHQVPSQFLLLLNEL